jgi:ribonuclease E
MVLNNKVLTVSYGTFSCTLEGFDDSFGTMKAIAEYFRDLASDDRYFGAEPPQPDADMLARIAQREISRQVEASTSASGILLRATEPQAVVSPPEPVPEPAPKSAPVLKAEPTVAAVLPVAEIAVEAEAETVEAQVAEPKVVEVAKDAPEVAEIAVAETVTAAPKVAEVEVAEPEVVKADVTEAAVTKAPVEEIEIAETVETAQEVETEHSDQIDEIAAVAAVMAATEDDTAENLAEDVIEAAIEEVAEIPVETVVEAVAETTVEIPAEVIAEAVPMAQPEPDFVPAADSIAAKLQRIRAVVSQNDQVEMSDDYTEDEHAEPFVTGVVQDITQALDADGEDLSVSPAIEAADDEISRVLGQLDASHEDLDDATDDQTVSDGIALFNNLDDEAEDEDDDLISNILGRDAPAAPVSEEPQVRARVVKVKRADLQAAIEAGDLEEIEDDHPAQGSVTADLADENGSLTAEDEADLLRELAAVEAELVPEVEAPQSAGSHDDDAAQVNAHDTQMSMISTSLSEDEVHLSRLMDAADEKLDDPETSTSRETYGHMRAAVAAAQAEHAAGGTVTEQNEDEAYREDLASVVRPRRPSSGGKSQRRPAADARPAPLKLVAEQRVDEGAGQVRRGAVRPRRVMTVPLEDADHVGIAEGEGGFADFATRMGATELPDILEAAAAYLSFVEGREQFSRPQLMNKVRQIKEDEFNREDGLRSFGQLLRDGKIQKTGGGRFTASGQIGFRPDTREAG